MRLIIQYFEKALGSGRQTMNNETSFLDHRLLARCKRTEEEDGERHHSPFGCYFLQRRDPKTVRKRLKVADKPRIMKRINDHLQNPNERIDLGE